MYYYRAQNIAQKVTLCCNQESSKYQVVEISHLVTYYSHTLSIINLIFLCLILSDLCEGLVILDSIFVPSLTSTIKCSNKNERFLLTDWVKNDKPASRAWVDQWKPAPQPFGLRGRFSLTHPRSAGRFIPDLTLEKYDRNPQKFDWWLWNIGAWEIEEAWEKVSDVHWICEKDGGW